VRFFCALFLLISCCVMLRAQYQIILVRDKAEQLCFQSPIDAFKVKDGVWDLLMRKGCEGAGSGPGTIEGMIRVELGSLDASDYYPRIAVSCRYPIQCLKIPPTKSGEGRYLEMVSNGFETQLKTYNLNTQSTRLYKFSGNIVSKNILLRGDTIFFTQIPKISDTTLSGHYNEHRLYNDSLMFCRIHLNSFEHDTLATFKQPIDSASDWTKALNYFRWHPSSKTLSTLRRFGIVYKYKIGIPNFVDSFSFPASSSSLLNIYTFLPEKPDTLAVREFKDSLPGTQMVLQEKFQTLKGDSILEFANAEYPFDFTQRQRYMEEMWVKQSEYLAGGELAVLWQTRRKVSQYEFAPHSWLTIIDTAQTNANYKTIPLLADSAVSDFEWFKVDSKYIIIGGGARKTFMEFFTKPFKNAYLLQIPLESTIQIKPESPVEIYPNPATAQITIKNADLELLQIHDLSGKRVKEIELSPQNEYNISVAELDVGLYILSVHTVEGLWIQEKIIKISP